MLSGSKWGGQPPQSLKLSTASKTSDAVSVAGPGLSAAKQTIPRELSQQVVKVVSEHASGAVQPRGLVNYRNTCFLNSVLQVRFRAQLASCALTLVCVVW